MKMRLVAEVAVEWLHARLFPHKISIRVSKDDAVIALHREGEGLKRLAHANCGRRMRLVPYGTVGTFSRGLECDRCGARIVIPYDVMSVRDLRRHFLELNG